MSEISGRIGGLGDSDEVPPGAFSGEPDAEAARWLRRRASGGVAVVTTATESGFRGTTLAAWLVASVEPLLILLSLEEDNALAEWIGETGIFVLNVLPWREQFAADQFAGYTPRASASFSGIRHRLSPGGVPILEGCLAWVECSGVDTYAIGDHQTVIGRARALGAGEGDEEDPLIYFLGRYRRLLRR